MKVAQLLDRWGIAHNPKLLLTATVLWLLPGGTLLLLVFLVLRGKMARSTKV